MDYNAELQKNLILYVCYHAPLQKLGTVKLNKILWFLDKTWYERTGETITGETYVKKPRGPVASHFYEVCEELKESGRLGIRKVGQNPEAERFEPVVYVCRLPVDGAGVDKEQQTILDQLISDICNKFTAREISQLSHDAVWKAAEYDEPLSFLRYHSQQVQPNAETLAWARESAEKYFAEHPAAHEA